MRIYEKKSDITVVIELSEYEAGALLSVCDCVGGPPDGPRGVIDQISDGLEDMAIAKQGRALGSMGLHKAKTDDE